MHWIMLSLLVAGVVAQDPANGWMAYAVGKMPTDVERITKLEMTWTVGAAPKRSFAFFSPWFGMDPEDNLNLIQPVNPWGGNSWSMYTEYFQVSTLRPRSYILRINQVASMCVPSCLQWEPEHNSNSPQKAVKPGDTLRGSLVYNHLSDSYSLSQTVVETGVTSTQVVKCQAGKKFLVPYVVYEKTFPCCAYPPDGVVTFHNITMECETASEPRIDCKELVQWSAEVKDDNCEMRAHIDSSDQIRITWDTTMASKYDTYSHAELVALNTRGRSASGWAKRAAEAASATAGLPVELHAQAAVRSQD